MEGAPRCHFFFAEFGYAWRSTSQVKDATERTALTQRKAVKALAKCLSLAAEEEKASPRIARAGPEEEASFEDGIVLRKE